MKPYKEKIDKPQIRALKMVGPKDWYDYVVYTLDDAQATFGKNYQAEISRNRALEIICRLYWEAKENGFLNQGM